MSAPVEKIRAYGWRVVIEQLLLEAFAAQRPAASPAALIADDFRPLPIIEGDGGGIALCSQMLPEEARGAQ